MRCDPEILRTLVEQSEEPGAETRGLFEHIERCRSCQEALQSIGGNESWWHDVRQWLGDEDAAAHRSKREEVGGPSESELALLQPPVHPEMLGRLGRYEIEGIIGRGGMGIVFRGFDSDLQRCVAIKVLAPQYAHQPLARQRFAREAQAAASVVHENVLPIFNVEAEADPPFLVMPYVAGATLERFVAQHGCPDAITVLRIARQIVEGLRAAHAQDLIHRDIKPGNILVSENVHRVWITDFGLARAVDDATLTHSGIIAGTPHFMSPEQARGQRLDARSDLYSFGAMLYFLCTGRPPFEADSTLAVLHRVVASPPPPLDAARPDLPPAFVTLVNGLLQKSPASRPRDADHVSKQIAKAIVELNGGITVANTRRGRKWWWGGALVAAATVAGLLATISLTWPHSGSLPVLVGGAARAVPSTSSASPDSPWLAPIIRKVDRELARPQDNVAIRRLEQRVERLESRTAVGVVHPNWQEPATSASQRQIDAVAAALQRLEAPGAASSIETVAADPTRDLARRAQRLRQRMQQLQSRWEIFP